MRFIRHDRRIRSYLIYGGRETAIWGVIWMGIELIPWEFTGQILQLNWYVHTSSSATSEDLCIILIPGSQDHDNLECSFFRWRDVIKIQKTCIKHESAITTMHVDPGNYLRWLRRHTMQVKSKGTMKSGGGLWAGGCINQHNIDQVLNLNLRGW